MILLYDIYIYYAGCILIYYIYITALEASVVYHNQLPNLVAVKHL